MDLTHPAEIDLLVIGGGLAGHAAALEAAEFGASVLLVEKMADVGGSTIQSSGSFAFAGTQAQRDAGYEDSPEEIRNDIDAASGGLADPALVSVYVEGQADAYAWLKSKEVLFHPVTLSSNQTVPRTHATQPIQLMEALHAKVLESERVHFLACAAARRLTTDAKGTVTGAIFQLKEGDWQIRARRGVVLATGGFSQNAELIEKFAPRMSTALKLGGSGNTGDGLLMAWKLGADLVDMAYVNGTFGISLNNYPDLQKLGADEAILRLAIYRGGIAVNLEAQRFADESISYKKLGEICLDQLDGVGFQIWDANIMAQSVPAPTATDLEGALARGLVRRADSIHELARTVGLTPERLVSTVSRYNADVDAGRDSVFGRTSLGRGWGTLVKIETPPFYIYPCTTGVLATYCGLRVTSRMECVDVFGEIIPNLYAAGEIVGGFHGSGYMSGSSLSKSVIFGRVAAATAVAA
jgi:fumarate reductase flavoprotein subunit